MASNWFGDKERGLATSIGIVSGPLGIFISKILILSIFTEEDKDVKGPAGNTKSRMTLFLILNSIIVVVMVLPALFLIREKPPSPPSMVATKKRPV